MPAKISSPILQAAFARIAQLSMGADLVTAANRHNTHIAFSSLISGGFTLNVIRTVLIDPRLQDSTGFDWLVCILAHELCHVQQEFWIDSVEQELLCYQLQARVCHELGLDAAKALYDRFLPLDPHDPHDLETALQFILELAGDSLPTQTIYSSLPKSQPTRFTQKIATGLKELGAAGRAGIQSARLTRANKA